VAAKELSAINDEIDIYRRKQLILDEVERFLAENQHFIESNIIQSIDQQRSYYSSIKRVGDKVSIIA
jgi:hypothetical protein